MSCRCERTTKGLDARLPGPLERTRRGWEAKRYTSQINWGQCRESVRRALAFWRPPRITFCFPRDLSAAEQESFRSDLAGHFPEVRLDFWSGSELQRLIRDTDEGRRAAAWLFANPQADREAMLRAMAVGGELAGSPRCVRSGAATAVAMRDWCQDLRGDPVVERSVRRGSFDKRLTNPSEGALKVSSDVADLSACNSVTLLHSKLRGGQT